MPPSSDPTLRPADFPGDDDEDLLIDERDPRLTAVPSGALALAGVAVALLMLAWLAIYMLRFLPRGMVS